MDVTTALPVSKYHRDRLRRQQARGLSSRKYDPLRRTLTWLERAEIDSLGGADKVNVAGRRERSSSAAAVLSLSGCCILEGRTMSLVMADADTVRSTASALPTFDLLNHPALRPSLDETRTTTCSTGA